MTTWQERFIQSDHYGIFVPRAPQKQQTAKPSSTHCPKCGKPHPHKVQDQLQQPQANYRDGWMEYWEQRGQPWRTEPEISSCRQYELAQRRLVQPDPEKGMYPFCGMRLQRADIEWLLATHDNGKGPIDWSDQNQHNREGLDLRGTQLLFDITYVVLLPKNISPNTHDARLEAG